MPGRIGRYLALERADRRALRRAFISLAMIDIVLRFAGFQRIVGSQPAAVLAESDVEPGALDRAWRYAHWLEVASRHHFVRARCLHRSLALHRWLRREGLPSQLRIGVRTEGRVLYAHAWVELNGHAVHERSSALVAFTPLAHPRVQRTGDLWRRCEQETWA